MGSLCGVSATQWVPCIAFVLGPSPSEVISYLGSWDPKHSGAHVWRFQNTVGFLYGVLLEFVLGHANLR